MAHRAVQVLVGRSGLHITRAPDDFGLVNGPGGPGKTKHDIVVTMLLMSANKKVKVLSPTNKAADLYTIKLNAELARLKDLGIVVTILQKRMWSASTRRQRNRPSFKRTAGSIHFATLNSPAWLSSLLSTSMPAQMAPASAYS